MDILKEMCLLFAQLTRAAARKKFYARKAFLNGDYGKARLLRAMARSEEVQARRILNSMKGKTVGGKDFPLSIVQEEVQEILDGYGRFRRVAEEQNRIGISHAVKQLRGAEMRLKQLLATEDRGPVEGQGEVFLVCPFCGYIAEQRVPDACPVCGAIGEKFEVVV